MNPIAPPTFEQYSAARLIQDRVQITRDWITLLASQLGVPPQRVLPAEELLDHIPEVLVIAAEFLLAPETERITAEQFVTHEMRNLAHLRRRQGFDVREVIREFDELARILDGAALAWLRDYPGPPDPESVGRVFGRLNRVPLLMGQVTVGTLEDERNDLLRRLASAEERERMRISRELHDQMGQLMTALVLRLKALDRTGESAEPSAAVAEVQRLADRIAVQIQQLALDLRAPALDSLGIKLALHAHLEEWSDQTGVEVDFHSRGLDGERFLPEVETAIYRVAQEGLTNVLKHAEARKVSVILERTRGQVSLILEDDGRGFDVDEVLSSPAKAKRLGLRGMRERVTLLGGRLDVESTPGSGTTLFAAIPEGRVPVDAPETDGRA